MKPSHPNPNPQTHLRSVRKGEPSLQRAARSGDALPARSGSIRPSSGGGDGRSFQLRAAATKVTGELSQSRQVQPGVVYRVPGIVFSSDDITQGPALHEVRPRPLNRPFLHLLAHGRAPVLVSQP